MAMDMISARGRRSGEGRRRGSRLWPCTGRGRRRTASLVSATLTTRSSLGLSATSSTGISSGKRCPLPGAFFFFFLYSDSILICQGAVVLLALSYVSACVWSSAA
jgi:hypothetical protein